MIPFPKIHIAESVLNRIQNALEDTGPLSLSNMTPPVIPDPTVEGQRIEMKAEETPEAAAPPPGTEMDTQNSMVESSVTGGSPFDGALLGALG